VEDQARENRATSATLDRPTQGRRHGGDVSGSRTDDGGNEGHGDYDGVGGGGSDGGGEDGGDGWNGDGGSGGHRGDYGYGGGSGGGGDIGRLIGAGDGDDDLANDDTPGGHVNETVEKLQHANRTSTTPTVKVRRRKSYLPQGAHGLRQTARTKMYGVEVRTDGWRLGREASVVYESCPQHL
jgi:hypothetical protein